jgi:trigger factor
MKEALFDKLFDSCKFEIPESMAKTEFDAIWQQLMQQKAQGQPTDLDNKSEKEVKKEYEEVSARRVALGIMLSSISKKDNIEISQQDMVNAIDKRAAEFPGQEDKVKDFYQQNPEAIKELAGPLLEEKVVDYLLTKVKLKVRKTTMKDLIAAEEKGKDKGKAKTKTKKPAKKKAKKDSK